MYCSNCGQDAGDAKFCPDCGAAVQPSVHSQYATGNLLIKRADLNTLAGKNIDVYVDGHFENTLDNTNALTLTMSTGTHEVKLQIDDYADAVSVIRVIPNTTLTYLLEVDENNKMTQLTKWNKPQMAPAATVRSTSPANRSENRTGGIICSRCGSKNVNIQVMQENQGGSTVTKSNAVTKIRNQGHGILWWLCIGWWWIFIDLIIWIFAFPVRLIIEIIRPKKKKMVTNATTVSHTANKIVYRKIFTCQNCGNSWSI